MPNYPTTMLENIDANMKFKREVVRALRAYKRSNPWSGSINQRKQKMRTLHETLCEIYSIRSSLNFVNIHLGRHSGNGCCEINTGAITLFDKLSIVTYLHEFAHALFGSCERRACRWSLNLFNKIFPQQFSRLANDGHMAVNRRAIGRSRNIRAELQIRSLESLQR